MLAEIIFLVFIFVILLAIFGRRFVSAAPDVKEDFSDEADPVRERAWKSILKEIDGDAPYKRKNTHVKFAETADERTYDARGRVSPSRRVRLDGHQREPMQL